MVTYAIKWDEKILVTEKNKNSLEWYKFIQEKILEKDLIEKEFQDTIQLFSSWYSQVEIDSWEIKVKEAEKVLNWETSEFLNTLVIEWETVEELVTKILQNSQDFQLAFANAEKIKREKLKTLFSN